MRVALHNRLNALTHLLSGMCEAASEVMALATQALLRPDPSLADTVIDRRASFDVLTAEAENTASRLLAIQAPLSRDLRVVVSTVKNTADAQRMAALAMNVATIARRHNPALPTDIADHFAAMGNLAVEVGHNVRDVVLTRDPLTTARVLREDDAMDDLHRRLPFLLTDRAWIGDASAVVDITLLGQFYERFAHHGLHIARRVIYLEPGNDAQIHTVCGRT